jgi:RNA ligase (TIGR02306 family)
MDIERKLASIRLVSAIDPIPGADNIVCLTIDGWKLVSQKDNFKVGDWAVYFEIDSFLPEREQFEFLRDRCFKSTKNLGDGFRLRTIKLRGQVSQGLALPLADFFSQNSNGAWFYMKDVQLDDPCATADQVAEYLSLGDDVTGFLGVQKYEKPIPQHLQGRVRGNFPSFIRKTDQERVQNCLHGVKKWIQGDYQSGELTAEQIAARQVFESTLKLDGSSMTVYYHEGVVGVCSRNLDLKREEGNTFWATAIAAGLPGMLAHIGRNIALQGEVMGPGIQGNRENLDKHQFFLFDVFDIDEQRYLTPSERRSDLDIALLMNNPLALEGHNMQHVPQLPPLILSDIVTVDKLIADADATPSIKHAVAEGIVYKSAFPGGPTFKVISNKFLLDEAKQEDKAEKQAA